MDLPTANKRALSDKQVGVLLVAPALIIFCVITLYPLVNTVLMSFTNANLLSKYRAFVGLANFKSILSDPTALQVLVNTLIFVIVATLVPFTLGLIWAIVLNEGRKTSEFLRGLTLVDWIIPSTAIGFLWSWIFQGNYGLLNAVLTKLGMIHSNIDWLGRPGTAMIAVIVAKTWQTLPWFMAFLLGGLKAVSHEQIEAAHLDGAGNIRTFLSVIMPQIKSIVSVVLILGFMGSLQQFDLIWVMTQGGPASATTTFSIDVYTAAFNNYDLGTASAIATVWVIIDLLFVFLYVRRLKDDFQ
ncbi:lactose transport system permease protein LacF [Peptococcaceae bacterium CEB3]|nr:lactose transport system permease protein LacF [Peptococcaceae bacterium CEB3]